MTIFLHFQGETDAVHTPAHVRVLTNSLCINYVAAQAMCILTLYASSLGLSSFLSGVYIILTYTGVPAWLAKAPVLGSALRGVVVRSAQRMIEDIEVILKRLNSSNDIHEVLRAAASKGHAKDAEKKAQAQQRQDKAQDIAGQKKSGVGGRFI